MDNNNFTWRTSAFDQLTTNELYKILKLRSETFVVEQKCIFLDMDDKDQKSYHLTCWNKDNDLVAYARILPAGISYKEISIGRIITAASYRGKGIGKKLIEQSLQYIHQNFGSSPVTIGAQLYLQQFYSSFGFKQSGDVYVEDGIEHIEMILPC